MTQETGRKSDAELIRDILKKRTKQVKFNVMLEKFKIKFLYSPSDNQIKAEY